jgi:photosystem II reaction center protein PsbP
MSISLSFSIFIVLTSISSLTNIDNKVWNVFALIETPKTTVNTINNNSSSITKENTVTLSSPSLSYTNSTYGIKMQYPSDWKILHGPATIFHNQSKGLNVVTEILTPIQSNYYNPKIGATHNSIRLVVEDYNTFGDYVNNNINSYIGNNNSATDDKIKLQTVANKRIGSIGIYCHDFDLKSWNQNATLAGNPANQIFLDYSYANNSKDATEIWTIKDNKIYLIEFVAQDKLYSSYLPIVNEMINSFQIINFY